MSTPAAAEPLLTAEEFERFQGEDEYILELVAGTVVRERAPAPLHGRLQAQMAHLLLQWVEERNRGGAVVTHTGFVLRRNPDTVRLPDVAHVSAERMPESAWARGLWQMGPDLAVEVTSPSNTWTEIQRKVDDYLGAGTLAVWVVDPPTRTVTVYRPGAEARRLDAAAELADDAVPGFRVPLARLFGV